MKTVKEICKLSGLSPRTLHHYDEIGLLKPSARTETGYRLYSNKDIERLQQIMLFKELEFPLKDIKEILERENFDKKLALEQQIELLTLKKERLENLIAYAKAVNELGGITMSFDVFNEDKIKEYARQAKAQWGDTEAYKECEEKQKRRSDKDNDMINKGLMLIFAEFGKVKDGKPSDKDAQSLVEKLQTYITTNYYKCTDEILSGLGKMYVAGGEFTENIDGYGGDGTAEFVHQAIEIYCKGNF